MWPFGDVAGSDFLRGVEFLEWALVGFVVLFVAYIVWVVWITYKFVRRLGARIRELRRQRPPTAAKRNAEPPDAPEALPALRL
jgi:hypothetical protein